MGKTIYELNLHESVEISSVNSMNNQTSTTATRVPGGWIYKTNKTVMTGNGIASSQASVFVPYSEEFKK